jgi:glutamate decarboxylase
MMLGPWGNHDRADSIRISHRALDTGINFVDTADVYSDGVSEEIVGEALRERRDDVFLATSSSCQWTRTTRTCGAVRGSTVDGSYEPAAEICAALDKLAGAGGPDVPVHVDGTSGAMIAPFLEPELEWDFRLPRVASINTSGPKYGLVYPGVGWVLWRDMEALPRELVFDVDYLGGDLPTFSLSFSRPGAEVVAQYYTFFRLGRAGFRAVQQASRDVAVFLAEHVAAMPQFRVISRGDQLPVVAFTTTDLVTRWDMFALSRMLRERGWQVPAYYLPADRQDLAVLRIVWRNGFSHDLADIFLKDLRTAVEQLRVDDRATTVSGPSGFHH